MEDRLQKIREQKTKVVAQDRPGNLDEEGYLQMEEELLGDDKTFLIQAVREYEEDMEEIYMNMPKELDPKCELMEVCCPDTSRLTETFKRRGKAAIRLRSSWS